ncbi:invertase/pectin methylesterase inhibitor family protein, partial [Genlisea aurea]
AGAAAADVAFVEDACRSTLYPSICNRSLSRYASAIKHSRRRLIGAAIGVSLERSRSVKAFLGRLAGVPNLRPRECAAVRDCLEMAAGGSDLIGKSMREIRFLWDPRSPEFEFHVSNVLTWLSAALTDETTCLDGFSGRGFNATLASMIRVRVTKLAKVTSNALALCN